MFDNFVVKWSCSYAANFLVVIKDYEKQKVLEVLRTFIEGNMIDVFIEDEFLLVSKLTND